MQADCRSFDEFWSAFTSQQRPDQFRIGRAGLSLARLVMKQRSAEKWRWAMAAAVLTAGKLLAGTFDEEVEPRPVAEDAFSLPAGDRPVPSRAAPPADVAWAAWM